MSLKSESKHGLVLKETFAHLNSQGKISPTPFTKTFWNNEVNSFSDGYLIGQITMNSNWTNWEMHPFQDEMIFVLSGSLLLQYDENTNMPDMRLTKGQIGIVPQGYWHTADIDEETTILFMTSLEETRHKPRES